MSNESTTGTSWETNPMALPYYPVFETKQMKQRLRPWNMDFSSAFWKDFIARMKANPTDNDLIAMMEVLVIEEESWTENTNINDALGCLDTILKIIKLYGHLIKSLCIRFRPMIIDELAPIYEQIRPYKVKLLIAVINDMPNLRHLQIIGGGLQLAQREYNEIEQSAIYSPQLALLEWVDVSEGMTSSFQLGEYVGRSILGWNNLKTLSIAWNQISFTKSKCKLGNVTTLFLRGLGSDDNSRTSASTITTVKDVFSRVTHLELVEFIPMQWINLVGVLDGFNSRKQLELIQFDETVDKIGITPGKVYGAPLRKLSFDLEHCGGSCTGTINIVKRLVNALGVVPCNIQVLIPPIPQAEKDSFATNVAKAFRKTPCSQAPSVTIVDRPPNIPHMNDEYLT